MPGMTFLNPVITDSEGLDHGDPFVLRWLDRYYLYHTGVDGIRLYTSGNLVDWDYKGIVLRPSEARDHWAQTDLWAPEVIFHRGTFYMYVAATKLQADGRGDDQARRLGIARSESPEGPFVFDQKPLVDWQWSIDGHPFQDEDGSLWLFYNIRTDATRYKDGTIGCGNVVDRLLDPCTLEGREAPVAFPTERWEGNRDGSWYWNEGPFTLKRRGLYYQMYSGGFYADDTYGVGFATAQDPRGPWTKYPGNPIYRTTEGILGPGHHCVVRGPDGFTPYVVYHGYVPGERGRKVHIDRLFWVGDRIEIAGPTAEEQPVPAGPVYDSSVPHWHLAAWVKGTAVSVMGNRIPLPEGGLHYVRVSWMAGRLRVWADEVLKCSGACEREPSVDVEGDALWLARQTCLEDDDIHRLAGGAARRWEWGGSGKLELSVAVRGRAVIRVDGRQMDEIISQEFGLVHKSIPCGAKHVEIVAGPEGAEMADLTMLARP